MRVRHDDRLGLDPLDRASPGLAAVEGHTGTTLAHERDGVHAVTTLARSDVAARAEKAELHAGPPARCRAHSRRGRCVHVGAGSTREIDRRPAARSGGDVATWRTGVRARGRGSRPPPPPAHPTLPRGVPPARARPPRARRRLVAPRPPPRRRGARDSAPSRGPPPPPRRESRRSSSTRARSARTGSWSGTPGARAPGTSCSAASRSACWVSPVPVLVVRGRGRPDDRRLSCRDPQRSTRRARLGPLRLGEFAYFTTTAVALLPTYFASVVVGDGGVALFGRTYAAESVWALAASAGAFVLLIAAPILGAVADFSGRKKAFLTVFAVTGALCATALSVAGEGDVALTLTLFLAAQSCFAVANVFYDGFLPDITTPETIDRVSAKGFAYGYLGGGLQFAIAVALLALHEPLGISTGAAIRVAIAMAGVWWLGFTVVALRSFREARRPIGAPAAPRLLAYPRVGLWRVLATIRQVGRMPHLLLFVLAYVIYNDGVQTVFVVAAVFGTETLDLSAQVIALTILVVQLVAFAGAHLFAHLAGCIGPSGRSSSRS
ncbi:MAG: MFS transporter [Sandaracinaceae bacterium]|nr:MFS transporter [Sandaracinaceae bacterium]